MPEPQLFDSLCGGCIGGLLQSQIERRAYSLNHTPNKESCLISPLDIFKIEKDGSLVWKSAAPDLGTAKLNIKVLAADSPGECMIFSQKTGNKIVVASEESS